MNRNIGMLSLYVLVILTIASGIVFTQFFSLSDEQQHVQEPSPSQLETTQLQTGEKTTTLSTGMPDADEGEVELDDGPLVLPFDLGQRMREWLAKKQLEDGYFYTPQGGSAKIKKYSSKEIMNTIPHFTRELLLVMYLAATDEFVVLLPGRSLRPVPPKCEGGCVRIENIMHAVLFAFRNRFPERFQQGGQDLMFLVSTGDIPRLSRDCLVRPKDCGRRKTFAPILHFGSSFSDATILPTLITMPPPPGVHLRCMAEWQVRHEICEFLLPKRTTEDGRAPKGIVFGEHINYNPKGIRGDGGLVWEDLIPQVVWRGADYPFLSLLHDFRRPDYKSDVEPKLKEYGNGVAGAIRAFNDVKDRLLPRWKAVLINAQAEFDANRKNRNPKRRKKALPWADMRFVVSENEKSNEYEQWNKLGIPALGEPISSEDMAKYKYQLDLGGGGGTSSTGTIQKLAMPGLLFHHETAAKDWYFEHLVPWIHYVPIKEDLSDLQEKYEWAEKHDRKAREIAKEGTLFVRRMGRPEGLDQLFRRHFLTPLEGVINAFNPSKDDPLDLLASGDDGFIFKEIMRCSGHNINECTLLQ